MLHSKATAALMRLKEMDRKYNIKRKEGRQVHSNVSTESSFENTPRNLLFQAGNNKLETVHTFSMANSETEIASKISPGFNVDIQLPSPHVNTEEFPDYEDPRTKKSFELSPRTKTEVLAEIDVTKRSISRSEKSLKSTSELESISENDFDTDSEIKSDASRSTGTHSHSEKPSVYTISSTCSAAPRIISEAIKSSNEILSARSDEKSDISERITTGNSIQASNLDNNESAIDEVIITDERSEIVSQPSHTTDKNNPADEDPAHVSSTEEQKLRYENDTFEEASESTILSSSVEEHLLGSSEEEVAQDPVISGVKHIKIIPHTQMEKIQEKVIDEEKNKEIIELIAPKIIQSNSECDVGLDKELSNYVQTTKNVDEVLPINLLKVSKQAVPTKKQPRKGRRLPKSFNENTEEKADSSIASDQEKLTEPMMNEKEATASNENGSPTRVKSVENEGNARKETATAKEELSHIEQAKVEPVVVEKEPVKNETEMVQKQQESVSSEELLRETPKKSDVTSTLRELNKDAIDAIVRRRRMILARTKLPDKSQQCRNCKAVVRLPFADNEYEAFDSIEDHECRTVFLENDSGYNHKVKGKRAKVTKVSKVSKVRKPYHGNVEEKHIQFDSRHTCYLRKQTAPLRMRQEREDIRNYMLGLEYTQLGYGSGESISPSQLAAFKPLEFPKIAAFNKPDLEDLNLESRDTVVTLQEKLLSIRQWLKDQYLLYRNYSKLAQTVNVQYSPVSLETRKRRFASYVERRSNPGDQSCL